MKRIHNPVTYIWAVLILLPWQAAAAPYLMRIDQAVWATLLIAVSNKDPSMSLVTFPSQSFLIIWMGSVALDIALLLFSVHLLGGFKHRASTSAKVAVSAIL